MPEIIDGNAIDLIVAEIDSAQAVKFCRSRQPFHFALLHSENSKRWKNLGEIAGQVVNGHVPHRHRVDTAVRSPPEAVALVKVIADSFCDVRFLIHICEVGDSARVSVLVVKVEVAWKNYCQARFDQQKS